MSKSYGWSISADWGATSALLTIKHTVKHIFSLNKMGRKIPLFIKGGALKNKTDISHGISVFSHGEHPTEFFCIVCLVPKLFCFFVIQCNVYLPFPGIWVILKLTFDWRRWKLLYQGDHIRSRTLGWHRSKLYYCWYPWFSRLWSGKYSFKHVFVLNRLEDLDKKVVINWDLKTGYFYTVI
jgi:hypothetical protein